MSPITISNTNWNWNNFIMFDREFQKFMTETEVTLQAIFGKDCELETIDFGDSVFNWNGYKYAEPFPEIKTLIASCSPVNRTIPLNVCKDVNTMVFTNATNMMLWPTLFQSRF